MAHTLSGSPSAMSSEPPPNLASDDESEYEEQHAEVARHVRHVAHQVVATVDVCSVGKRSPVNRTTRGREHAPEVVEHPTQEDSSILSLQEPHKLPHPPPDQSLVLLQRRRTEPTRPRAAARQVRLRILDPSQGRVRRRERRSVDVCAFVSVSVPRATCEVGEIRDALEPLGTPDGPMSWGMSEASQMDRSFGPDAGSSPTSTCVVSLRYR